MTTLTLPASVHPDVLIADGHTYVALPLPEGLMIDVIDGSDPEAIDRWLFPVGDWPRLFAHASGVLVAWKTSDDNCLTVANVTTGALTRTGIPASFSSPIAWRSDGLLCCQTGDAPIEVWSGLWPEPPKPPALRPGVGTGLAQWVTMPLTTSLYTWDELNSEYVSIASQVVEFDLHNRVGQWPQGGIYAMLGGKKTGVLLPFTSTNDPRPALAADGSLSIIYWVAGSQGSTSTVLLQGVTAADLIVNPQPPMRPLSDVVPLPGQSVAGSFVFPQ